MVLYRLFQSLHAQRVIYCAVGDVRRLPTHIDSDIDLVVDPTALADIPTHLYRFCADHALQLVQCLQHESTAFYFVLSWVEHGNVRQFLHVDVCGDYYRAGRLFLNADEVLSFRTTAVDENGQPKGFFIPAPAHAFIYYLLKRIDKQALDSRHGEYLTTVWRLAPEAAHVQVMRFWSGADAQLLSDAAGSGSWQAVRAALPLLRRELHRALAPTRRSRWLELARRLRRVRHPTGLLVAVIGPNGRSNDTVVEAIRRDLAPAFRRTGYFHLHPLTGSRVGADDLVSDPNRQPVREFAKAARYGFEYAVGYAFRVWPKLVASTLVIFDRRASDLAADPSRSRHAGPSRIARLIGRVVPRPDFVIVLDAPAADLLARTPDLSDELSSASPVNRHVANALSKASIIDAALPTAEVIAQAESAILGYMADRTWRRLGAPNGYRPVASQQQL